jgi:hypothetical protein
VIISAPDATKAAAFCSKSLYFPVPTMRREVKVRPATVQLSVVLMKAALAATDKVDNLQNVAIGKDYVGKR